MSFIRWICPVLLAVGLVAGCRKTETATNSSGTTAPALASGEKVKIGFLVKQPEEPWFQYEGKAAAKTGARLGFEVLFQGTQDGEKVMSAIDNLAVSGAQGFVICTPDVRLGPAIVKKASQKGLKVIAIDDQFVSGGKFMTDVPYVGMSASRIGKSVGETLLAEMKKRGWTAEDTATCVVTFEELDTARERTDNAIAALKAGGFPEKRIFKAPQKTTDIPGSFDATGVLLTQNPDVKHWLIAGMNDSAVLGAVRAMEQRGFTAETAVGIGINGTDCIDELRKPRPTAFYGSMFASAPAEGAIAAEMLYRWIKDGVVPPADTRSEAIFITRENFEQVLRKEGVLE